MIVVAIIGLLSVVMLGSMVKARKRSEGERIVNDVRQVDDAITQWAVDTNQKDGAPVDWTAVSTYLKRPIAFIDIMGNPYVWGNVGSAQFAISWNTKFQLNGVGIDWGIY
jgi:type II secretory pathway pseudopilin PulG